MSLEATASFLLTKKIIVIVSNCRKTPLVARGVVANNQANLDVLGKQVLLSWVA